MSYRTCPRRTLLFALLLTASVSVSHSAVAGDAFLVRDLDTTEGELGPGDSCPSGWGEPCFTTYRGSYPLGLVALGDELLFAASDRVHGGELWRSDGTASGTVRITDLCPGGCTSVAGVLGRLGDEVLFWATDREEGPPHLWKSDGTAAGTARVAEICAAHCEVAASEWERHGQSAWPTYAPVWGPKPVEFGGRLYFFAGGDGAGQELWSTDGTTAGTSQLADFHPGPGNWVPLSLLAADDGVFAVGRWSDGWPGTHEVWRSAGTPATTRRVFDSPLQLNDAVVHDGTLYVAMDGTQMTPPSLWAVGPAGGRRIWRASLVPGTFQELAVADGKLYFVQVDRTWHPGPTEEGRYDLWVFEGGSARRLSGRFSTLRQLATVGDRLYLVAEREEGVGMEDLYATRGVTLRQAPEYPGGRRFSVRLRTFGDTLVIQDRTDYLDPNRIFAGDGMDVLRRVLSMPWVGDLDAWVAAGDHLFFTADDGERGFELWAVPRRALRPDAFDRLLGERFEVSVLFENQHAGGEIGSAIARPLTDDSTRFWFFRPENTELVVKVLDGRGVNGHAWVFHGGTTDLGYRVSVRDRESGTSRVYERAPGTLCGGADSSAFALTTPLAAPSAPMATSVTAGGIGGACDTASALCLNAGRFQVQVRYRDHANGGEGTGVPVADSDRAGWFWFFDDANLEVMAKVLDGRPVNGHWWVFLGGLTTLETAVEVTDLAHPDRPTRTFVKPAGSTCGVADVTAFAEPSPQ